jgi:hypothetical protein
MTRGQSGQALPLAIIALAIGSLVVAPFLSNAGSDLIGTRVYGEAIAGQSAGDAGIEHAIWSLTRGTLAEQLSQPGDEATYQLPETLNGLTVSVTVTANATGSGAAGDITDDIIDSLEFDTANGYEPYMIQVSGDIYAVVYRGGNSDGFVKTVSINTGGEIGNSTIDMLEFDGADGYEPCIIRVAGNIFAIVYRGAGSDGFIKTVSINDNGDIDPNIIDTAEYDDSSGYEPSPVGTSGDIYAIAYRGAGNDGFIKTVSINEDGDIGNSAIDTLEFDPAAGYEPSLVRISADIYAVAYRGADSDGFIKTVSIDDDGNIDDHIIDTLEFDTTSGHEPDIIKIYDDVYAVAYRGPGNNGRLKTVSITAGGDIGGGEIDAYTFDSNGYEPRIINVTGEIYAIAYRGPGNRGSLKTITIAASGDSTVTTIDTLEFDSVNGHEPFLISISGDIYAIAYRGQNSDGFIKTARISGSGETTTYDIMATAGETTLRARIDIANGTVIITSWQIE